MNDHVIAQCQWQTEFDDASNTRVLQDAISQWSNQVLPDVIGEFFDECCPSSQIWRIDRLVLDLGMLTLSDLDALLAQRIRSVLETEMAKLFASQQIEFYSSKQPNFRVIDKCFSEMDMIKWYLINGNLPWWSAGQVSPLSSVDQLLIDQPKLMAALVREIGRTLTVRQRIVWQWGELRTRRLIAVLEPWNTDFICRYADNLLSVQASQHQVVDRQSPVYNPIKGVRGRAGTLLPRDSKFRQHIWYWILTHLLVERGSLFNTQEFVRSTLVQMCQHYQLDYMALLNELNDGVEAMGASGLVAPQFLQVLTSLHQKESSKRVSETSSATPDLWSLLASMLRSRQSRGDFPVNSLANSNSTKSSLVGQRRQLGEVLSRAAEQSVERTAKVLKHEGRSHVVREFMIRQLNQDELALVVEVVEPREHRFILSHVALTQQNLSARHIKTELIWQVLLAYLLVSNGSYFNRRQFVQTTLEDIARRHRLRYSQVLYWLTQAPLQLNIEERHFELLIILKDLHRTFEANASQAETRSIWSGATDRYASYWQIERLKPANELSPPKAIFLRQIGLQETGKVQVQESPIISFLNLLKKRGYTASTLRQLSQHYIYALEVTGGLTLSGLKRLFIMLSKQEGYKAFLFLQACLDWHEENRLRLSGTSQQTPLLELLSLALIESLLRYSAYGTGKHWTGEFLSILTRSPDSQKGSGIFQQIAMNMEDDREGAQLPRDVSDVFVKLLSRAPSRSPSMQTGVSEQLKDLRRLAIQSESFRRQEAAKLVLELLNKQTLNWREDRLTSSFSASQYLMECIISRLPSAEQSFYLSRLYVALFGDVYSDKAPNGMKQQIVEALASHFEVESKNAHFSSGTSPSLASFRRTAPLAFEIFKQTLNQPNATYLLERLSCSQSDSRQNINWLSRLLPTFWRRSEQQTALFNQLSRVIREALLAMPSHAKALSKLDTSFHSSLPNTLSLSSQQLTSQLRRIFWQRIAASWRQENLSSTTGGIMSLPDSEQGKAAWLVECMLDWARQSQISQVTFSSNMLTYLRSDIWHSLLGSGLAKSMATYFERVLSSYDVVTNYNTVLEPALDRHRSKRAVDDRTFNDRTLNDSRNASTAIHPKESQNTPAKTKLSADTLPKRHVTNIKAFLNQLANKADRLEQTTLANALVQWLKTGYVAVINDATLLSKLSIETRSILAEQYASMPKLLADLLRYEAGMFRRWISPAFASKSVQSRLARYLSLTQVMDALIQLKVMPVADVNTVRIVQTLLAKLQIERVTLSEKQTWLQHSLLQAWMTQNWQLLTPSQLIQQLCWKMLDSGSCTIEQLISLLQQDSLPASPQINQALDESIKVLKALLDEDEPVSAKIKPRVLTQETTLTPSASIEKSGLEKRVDIGGEGNIDDVLSEAIKLDDALPVEYPVEVNNAGLALIQSFIQPLFERLSLTENNQFIDISCQRTAVHCLQFLATGQTHTEEYHLLFNKLLCGLSPFHPVEAGVELHKDHVDTVHSLIDAVTNYWSAIGQTSLDGFRGNWMVRKGTLTETKDHWDLIVEKRAYDVLIARSPLSFSIIKLPWMEKPIYVTWPT